MHKLIKMENNLNRNMIVLGFLIVMIIFVIIILAVFINRNRNYPETSTSANEPSNISEDDINNINLPKEIEKFNYEFDKLNEGGY